LWSENAYGIYKKMQMEYIGSRSTNGSKAMRDRLAAMACAMLLMCQGSAIAQDWAYRAGALGLIDPSTLAPTLTIPVRRVDAMASDAAAGLWYALPGSIVHRDSTGSQVLEVSTARLGFLDKVAWMAGDAYSGEVWASDGVRLTALAPTGEVRAVRPLGAKPVALVIGGDSQPWLLEKARLLRLRRDGSPAQVFDLRPLLGEEARYLALDDFNGRTWVLGERRAVAFDGSGSVAGRFAMASPGRGACVMPGADGLWVLTAAALELRDPSGQLLRRTGLASLGVARAAGLACHWVRQEIWLPHEAGIVRVGTSGSRAGSVALGNVLRVEPVSLRVLPVMRLVQPPAAALTNDPRPLFELALGADCPVGPCPSLPTYLDRARIDATLDGRAISPSIQVDNATATATYQPQDPLGEGVHRFVATLADRFGRTSSPLDASVTVDTVPPVFVRLTPEDGTVLSGTQAIVSGTVDDADARVVFEDQAKVGAVALTAPPGSFSFSVSLQPGTNVFSLSAIDPAGNVTRRSLRIGRTAEGIVATVVTPLDGATVQRDSVVVRGTFQADGQRVGVSVNGEPAALVGGEFHAQVPLEPGTNVLEVRLTTADGRTSTRTLTVTRQGTLRFRVNATPATGIAPNEVRFDVGPLDARGVARIQIDYQGDGTIDASTLNPAAELRFTYAQPGVYQARVIVTDTVGDREEHMVQVAVLDLAALDGELKGLLQTMLSSLRAGNVDAALQAFSPSVQGRYRDLFQRAGANLPTAVERLGTVQDGSIFGSMAEYVMVQDRPSGPKAYFVYLMKARDGLWRIQQM